MGALSDPAHVFRECCANRVYSILYGCICAVVNASHEGKRKVELLWPVHQINNQRT